jgi:DNA-binding CsgD family transcriptional regulator/PAS domain-containing protein
MDPTEFSALVAKVYEASIDFSRWGEIAPLAARTFNSTSCLLQFQNRSTGVSRVLGYTPNFTPAKIADYGQYYYARDPWATGALAAGSGVPVLGGELVPEKEVYGSELYADWLQPCGVFDLAGGSTGLENGNIGLLGIHRPYDAPRFDREAQRWMALLLAHFGRALDLHNRLETVQRRLDVALDALNALQVGILIVNPHASIVYANAAAEAHLRPGRGIIARHNHLGAEDAAKDEALKRMIKGASLAAGGRSLSTGGLISIPVPDAGPLSLLVCPLSSGFARLDATGPMAMIFIGGADEHKKLPERVLTMLYGLTQAEARLASALLMGETLQGYGERLAISANTTKTQLKSIFAKTGHSRQSDLIRDLTANPVLRMLRQ